MRRRSRETRAEHFGDLKKKEDAFQCYFRNLQTLDNQPAGRLFVPRSFQTDSVQQRQQQKRRQSAAEPAEVCRLNT